MVQLESLLFFDLGALDLQKSFCLFDISQLLTQLRAFFFQTIPTEIIMLPHSTQTLFLR